MNISQLSILRIARMRMRHWLRKTRRNSLWMYYHYNYKKNLKSKLPRDLVSTPSPNNPTPNQKQN